MQVYVEAGDKKAFACAVDWPGWCRAGKDEGAALERLIDYTARYAEVARLAGVPFSPGDPHVLERVRGNATTDFGAPGVVPALDEGHQATATDLALLEACWQLLESTAAVTPAELRKGPRGGGRDRDKMLQHVLGAEAAYARQIGVKHKEPDLDDRAAVQAMRADIVAALRGSAKDATWPARYFVRRTAWHVLDHAWEMQDRSDP
jgi:hypothetical protein